MEYFKINSKIELITEDDDRFYGIISDLVENKIYFTLPGDDKDFKLLRIGDKIRGIVYDKHKITGFNATVSDRLMREIPTYELSELKDFSIIQRRENVRIPCTIPILYTNNKYLMNITENSPLKKPEEIHKDILRYLEKGLICDISAGGLKFSCNDNYSINQMILMDFKIDDKIIIVKGEIVYKEIKISPGENKTLYIYGLQFKGLRDEVKEKIINYIFVLMRKNTIKK